MRTQVFLLRPPCATYAGTDERSHPPPDLERFADEAVAAGRYRNHAEVVGAAVSLLREVERQRAELHASVVAAQDEGDRDGYLTGAELVERVEARLAGRPAPAA